MQTIRRNVSAILVVLAVAISFFSGYAVARQPHMLEARGHLERAANQLRQAEHDKAGHREKALELTNQALSEVSLGIEAGRH
jgi:hypothetical protein